MFKMTFTGHAGKDAEVKFNSQTGEQFAVFSVAVRAGNKENPRTEWIDVICGGKLSEVAAQYVKTGTKVLIEGTPSAHGYVGKEQKINAKLNCSAKSLELLDRKPEDETPATDEE